MVDNSLGLVYLFIYLLLLFLLAFFFGGGGVLRVRAASELTSRVFTMYTRTSVSVSPPVHLLCVRVCHQNNPVYYDPVVVLAPIWPWTYIYVVHSN